jgi:hypothetical protein
MRGIFWKALYRASTVVFAAAEAFLFLCPNTPKAFMGKGQKAAGFSRRRKLFHPRFYNKGVML